MASSDPDLHFREVAPTLHDVTIVSCPACRNDHGEPVGELLVQLPSGTWVRRVCDTCHGLKKLDSEGRARHMMRTTAE